MDERNNYVSHFEWNCGGHRIEVYHNNRFVPVLIYIDGIKYGYAEFEKGFEPKLKHEILWEELKLTLIFRNGSFTLLDNGAAIDNGKENFATRFQLEIKLWMCLFAVVAPLFVFIKNANAALRIICAAAGIGSVAAIFLIFRSQKLSSCKKIALAALCVVFSCLAALISLGVYASVTKG
ncbi:MAG: hypothetical protein IJU52_02600 [Clostridia bacterium]|nr:hypothetical protein [Clostridia bacterium]